MELVLASHCLVDVALVDRVAAAASAGFDAIGLSLDEYDRARRSGLSDADVGAVLAGHGIAWAELEVVRNVDQPRPPELERAVRIGERFGLRRLQAIGTMGTEAVTDRAAEHFAAVCDLAGSAGMSVALEFLPISSVPDVSTAAEIVAGADRPNGGLCVDAWHFFRGSADFTALEDLPARSVQMLQLDDGTLLPQDADYLRDTLDNRMLPGSGEFDLVRLLSVLSDTGNLAAVSAEVISSELRALPASEITDRIAVSSRALLNALAQSNGACDA